MGDRSVLVLQNTMARAVAGLSFAADGQTLIAGGSGGYDLWHLQTASHLYIPSHAVKRLWGCRYDPMGRWIYVTDSVRGLRLLPAGGGEALPPPGTPYVMHVTSFDLSGDGTCLAMTRGGAGQSRVECWKVSRAGLFFPAWSLLDGKPINPDELYYFNQAKWWTNAVAISRDGKVVVTAENRSASASGDRPTIVQRQGGTGKAVADLGTSATGFDMHLAVAADGKGVFAWDGKLLERWDFKSGQCKANLATPGRGTFTSLAVHSSGRVVVTASTDGQARTWDAHDLRLVHAVKCQVGKLHAVALSPDGKTVAVGGDKGQVALWHLNRDAGAQAANWPWAG